MELGEVTGPLRWNLATRRRLRWPFHQLWDHLAVEDPPAPADAIFCFGSRHWRVPERAAALFHAGLASHVLVTGAAVLGDDRTEAERFAASLVHRGVPASRIIAEHRACHTGENVLLGIDALREHLTPRRLLLVSWPLAARRCRATFAAHAPEVEVLSAPALREPGYRWEPTARRARFALGEVERLVRYSDAGAIQPQELPLSVELAAEVLRAELAGPERSAFDLAPVEVEPARPLTEAQEAALLH
ncbi:MAG: YdcF family protein [Acidimicrobiales bacterium]